MRPVPLHHGADNALAVANLQRIKHGVSQRRPWEIKPNGDILKKRARTIQQRGEGAIKHTKIKGHETDDHVAKHTTTTLDKHGNDTADDFADRAYTGFPEHLREFANPFVHKTESYAELVEVIQPTNIRMLEALQRRRKTLAIVAPTYVRGYVIGFKKRPWALSEERYPCSENTPKNFSKVANTNKNNILKR